VERFDKGSRINSLIAGVRVVLRIEKGCWSEVSGTSPFARSCLKSRTLQLPTGSLSLAAYESFKLFFETDPLVMFQLKLASQNTKWR
jgi:hypothetical protein